MVCTAQSPQRTQCRTHELHAGAVAFMLSSSHCIRSGGRSQWATKASSERQVLPQATHMLQQHNIAQPHHHSPRTHNNDRRSPGMSIERIITRSHAATCTLALHYSFTTRSQVQRLASFKHIHPLTSTHTASSSQQCRMDAFNPRPPPSQLIAWPRGPRRPQTCRATAPLPPARDTCRAPVLHRCAPRRTQTPSLRSSGAMHLVCTKQTHWSRTIAMQLPAAPLAMQISGAEWRTPTEDGARGAAQRFSQLANEQRCTRVMLSVCMHVF